MKYRMEWKKNFSLNVPWTLADRVAAAVALVAADIFII
jgi:hypothetical protein